MDRKKQNQQEVILKLSVLEQKIQQLQQQLQSVERGINELQSLSFDLDNIKDSKGKEILAQIGRGVYIKAKILSEDLMVDIGERKIVKRNVSETKKIIETQIKKLRKVEKDLSEDLEKTNSELTKIFQKYQDIEK